MIMTGYRIITIDSLLDSLGEDGLNAILSSYSCPRNSDIEDFLHHKALTFSRQGLAKTHLVFASYKGKPVLVGYFALSNKTLFIPDKSKLSKRLKQRINKFATHIDETRMNIITAPLIAQLGKNYAENYDSLITGDELLKMACERIQEIQLVFGGKVAYLECQNKPELIHFYEENGFREFNSRVDSNGEMLVQMIRYF